VFIEEHYGFTEAYGLTLGLMLLALFMLVFGRKWYAIFPHQDNLIIPQATKIIGCAVKNGFRMKRAEPYYQLEHRRKIVTWSSSMVEELTRGLRGCRVLLAFIMFYVCFDQMQNNLISQAGSMKTNGTPNDMLPALNQVGCIVLGPVIQMGLYPFLHRRRIYIGPIMRITIGFGFVALSMLYSTVVQYAIYNSPPCYDRPSDCSTTDANQARPNVWIQAPVYFLISTGEIFAYVTGLEYAYDHSPKDMKVIVQAISLIIGGLGSAVALALTAIAHDPNLVIFYASLTAGMAITAIIFWTIFRSYDRPAKSASQATIMSRRSDSEQGELLQQTTDSPRTRPGLPFDAGATSPLSLCAQQVDAEKRLSRPRNTSETTLVPTTQHHEPAV
jgi:POT family proton-dependent oligopeptide transporter